MLQKGRTLLEGWRYSLRSRVKSKSGFFLLKYPFLQAVAATGNDAKTNAKSHNPNLSSRVEHEKRPRKISGWNSLEVFFTDARRNPKGNAFWVTVYSSALDIGCGSGLLDALGLRCAIGIDVRPGAYTTIFASVEYLSSTTGVLTFWLRSIVIRTVGHLFLALGENTIH